MIRKKLNILLCLAALSCIGCTTPQPIYDDLNIIKTQIAIEKEIADTMLDAIVPKNQQQVEAIMKKKLEIEEKYDRIASAINRLIIYFQAEKDVGYIVNAVNFAKTSEVKGLLDQIKKNKETQ